MHRNEIMYTLICINNHVLSCLINMLSVIQVDQERGPICLVDRRATIDDPRPHACEDVDTEVSCTITTRRTPGAIWMKCTEAACRILSSEHLIILRFP